MGRGIHLPLVDPEPSPVGSASAASAPSPGYNGHAKNPLAEGIEAAGSRRIRGIAAQTILLAFHLAHANRRRIKKWLETLALGGERALRRTHHRRKIKEPGTWTPTGHLSSAA